MCLSLSKLKCSQSTADNVPRQELWLDRDTIEGTAYSHMNVFVLNLMAAQQHVAERRKAKTCSWVSIDNRPIVLIPNFPDVLDRFNELW
jgi:hypothetical protein